MCRGVPPVAEVAIAVEVARGLRPPAAVDAVFRATFARRRYCVREQYSRLLTAAHGYSRLLTATRGCSRLLAAAHGC